VSKWLGRRSRVPKSLQIVVTRLGAATNVLGVLEAESIPQVKAVSIGEAPHDSSKVQVLVELWSWPHGDVVDRLVDALADALGDDLQSVTPNR
jgi:hypothetical protein